MVTISVEQYQRIGTHDYCAITLTNQHGVEATILNYGATLMRYCVPDRDGTLKNMVLSLPTPADYSKARNYLGGTVGRIIGRMAKGQWQVGEQTHQFVLNDGTNHVHGGPAGFDTQVFDFKVQQREHAASVNLTLFDPAGHNGYPGNMKLQVTYTLTDTDQLQYQLSAYSDALTLCNPANHAYFNLDGGGQILKQTLQIAASTYLPLNANSIPDAGRRSVANTSFDFRKGRQLGDVLASQDPQILEQKGLNHPFLLDGQTPAATLISSDHQRQMTLITTAPAIVVYTGNHFDHSGVASNIGQYDGVALEAQFPPTDDPTLPSIVLLPGEHFEAETSWQMAF